MFQYTAFALSIHSEIELTGLSRSDAPPDVIIRLGAVPFTTRRATGDEEFAFNVTQAGGFHVRGGTEIVVDPIRDADPSVVRSMLLGRVMAYLLRQRGWLPLHGSAIAASGRGVVFLGDSGAGKSTLAAAFHHCGHAVVSDEVAAVRVRDGNGELRFSGTPIRLEAVSAAAVGIHDAGFDSGDKRAFKLSDGTEPGVFGLRCLCALSFGDRIRMQRVTPAEAVQILSKHAFVSRRGLTRQASEAHFYACSEVASAVPLYSVSRPRSLDLLPEVVAMIAERVLAE